MPGQKLSQAVVLREGNSLMEQFQEMLKLKNDILRSINRLEPNNYEPEDITILDVNLLKIAEFSIICEVIYRKKEKT